MMHKGYGASGRSGSIFLTILFALGLFSAAVSVQGAAPLSATTPLESPVPKFLDTNDIDSSQSAPDDTVAFVFQQGDGGEHPAWSLKDTNEQVRAEILYGENKLVLVSDQQERTENTLYRATGNVVITFLDMVITCDEAEYDERTLRVSTRGKTSFRQKRASLTGSNAEFDPDTQTITLHDASGYFYDTSGRSDREFFLTDGMVQYIEADELQIYWGTAKKD